MIKKFRLTLFILFSAFIIATATFIFLPHVIQWQLKDHFEKKYGAKISFENFLWSKKNISIKKVFMKSLSNDLIDYECVVEDVIIDYSIHFLNAQIFIKSSCESINVLIDEKMPVDNLYDYFKSYFNFDNHFGGPSLIGLSKDSSLYLFDTSFDLFIKKINLDIQNNDKSLNRIEGVSFDAHIFSNKNMINSYHLFASNDKGTISVDLEKSLNIQMQHFEGASYFAVYEKFFGPLNEVWSLKSAKIDGSLSIYDSHMLSDCSIEKVVIEHLPSGIKANFPLLKVKALQKADLYAPFLFQRIIQNTYLKAELYENASLYRFKEGLPYWALKDISGIISLNEILKQGLQLDLKGQFLFTNSEDASLTIRGNIPVSEIDEKGNILFDISSNNQDSVSANLILNDKGASGKDFDLYLKNISPREVEAIRNIWPQAAFVWNEAQFLGGLISLHAQGSFLNGKLVSKLNIENVTGKNIWFKSPSLSTEGFISSIEANCDFIIKPDLEKFQPINGQIHLIDADFYWESKSLYDGREVLGRLNQFELHCVLNEGILESASFKGNLGGLQAELEFLGLESQTVANMKLDGALNKIFDIVPGILSDQIKGQFSKEIAAFQASLTKKKEGLLLDGSLHIFDELSSKQPLVIDVNAYFERLIKPVFSDLSIEWKKWGIWLLEKKTDSQLPFERKASTRIIKINWLKDTLGPWALILKQGTFAIKELDFERLSRPFLNNFKIEKFKGLSAVYGDFNDKSLIVNFEINHFNLETKDFNLIVEEIPQEGQDKLAFEPSSFVYYDFHENSLYGFMPIENAYYLERNTSLEFKNISGLLSLNQNHLTLAQIDAECEKIYFKGTFDLDFSDKEALKISLKAPEVYSDTASVQKFSSRFIDLPLWQLPIEGKIESSNEGVVFDAIVPYGDEKNTIFWSFSSKISNVTALIDVNNAHFTNLFADLSYTSVDKTFKIKNFVSDLDVIDKDIIDKYEVAALETTLNFSTKSLYDFDINIKNNQKHFARLKATIQTIDEVIYASLDTNHFHIGNIYPKVSDLIYDKNEGFKFLKAKPSFELGTVFEELNQLNHANLFRLVFKEKFSDLPLSSSYVGKVLGNIKLENKDILLDFASEKLTKNNKSLRPFLFKAQFHDDAWMIENINFDTFSALGVLEKNHEEFVIKNLELNDIGLSCKIQGLIKGYNIELNDVHAIVDLNKLSQTTYLQYFPAFAQAQGIIEFFGHVFIGLGTQDTKNQINLTGKVDLDHLEILSHHFHNQKALSVSYSNSEGLSVKDIVLTIKQANLLDFKTDINLQAVHYNFDEGLLKIDSLGFELSSGSLEQVAYLLQDFFPHEIDEKTLTILKEIKSQKSINGYLHVEIGKGKKILKARLDDGIYSLFNKEIFLKTPVFNYENGLIKILFTYDFQQYPLNIGLEFAKENLNTGTLTVAEPSSKLPLQVFWTFKEDLFQINQIDGSLFGLQMALKLKKVVQDIGQNLTGQVALTDLAKFEQIAPQFIQSYLDNIQFQSFLVYTGDIFLPFKNMKNFSLNGKIEVKDFSFYSRNLSNLKLDLSYTEFDLHIEKMSIEDGAFNLFVKDMFINKNVHEQWYFKIPKLLIQELKPIKLAKDKKALKSIKNLVIHDVNVDNLTGLFSDLKTIKGKGYFSFEKISKNTFSNILFAIPNDILSRIGLNLNVMIPAQGKVYFEIKDRKFYLTQLSEVYSEGKYSRFYLPKDAQPSFIDFDANLNVYIKVKQYNLLMKLTESLRVHLTGKLNDPSFQFEKDSSNDET
jgi:hypothetical protein